MRWINRLAPIGALAIFALTPSSAASNPITLSLAYFSSDGSHLYQMAIRPFVEAVNADPAGLIRIEVHFSGELGPDPTQQVRLVQDGVADMAFIIPGYTPDLFRDNAVIELPGVYRDLNEATLVFSRLVAADAFRGYEDLFVVGAFATEPESIHLRPTIAGVADLAGKRIRVNNVVEGAALEALGAVPVLVPINQTPGAIGRGEVDGATVPPAALIEFGIARVTTTHLMLGVGSAPLALVMSQEAFDRLPVEAQSLIRRFSGEWLSQGFIDGYRLLDQQAMSQLSATPGRTVIIPTEAEQEQVDARFAAVVAEWVGADPRNADLFAVVQTELARIRAGE
jgi:TRAP-type C4-dicarboxylate transport system substrate-binding protein